MGTKRLGTERFRKRLDSSEDEQNIKDLIEKRNINKLNKDNLTHIQEKIKRIAGNESEHGNSSDEKVKSTKEIIKTPIKRGRGRPKKNSTIIEKISFDSDSEKNESRLDRFNNLSKNESKHIRKKREPYNRETIYGENFNDSNYNISSNFGFPIINTKVEQPSIVSPDSVLSPNEILRLDKAGSTLKKINEIDMERLKINKLEKSELSAISQSALKNLNNKKIIYLDSERNMEHQTSDIKAIINGEID